VPHPLKYATGSIIPTLAEADNYTQTKYPVSVYLQVAPLNSAKNYHGKMYRTYIGTQEWVSETSGRLDSIDRDGQRRRTQEYIVITSVPPPRTISTRLRPSVSTSKNSMSSDSVSGEKRAKVYFEILHKLRQKFVLLTLLGSVIRTNTFTPNWDMELESDRSQQFVLISTKPCRQWTHLQPVSATFITIPSHPHNFVSCNSFKVQFNSFSNIFALQRKTLRRCVRGWNVD